MPVQKKGCFFAACGMLFCLIVLPCPAFTASLQKTPEWITQEGTITSPSAEALSGFCGKSYHFPDHAKEQEQEIIVVNP